MRQLEFAWLRTRSRHMHTFTIGVSLPGFPVNAQLNVEHAGQQFKITYDALTNEVRIHGVPGDSHNEAFAHAAHILNLMLNKLTVASGRFAELDGNYRFIQED